MGLASDPRSESVRREYSNVPYRPTSLSEPESDNGADEVNDDQWTRTIQWYVFVYAIIDTRDLSGSQPFLGCDPILTSKISGDPRVIFLSRNVFLTCFVIL